MQPLSLPACFSWSGRDIPRCFLPVAIPSIRLVDNNDEPRVCGIG